MQSRQLSRRATLANVGLSLLSSVDYKTVERRSIVSLVTLSFGEKMASVCSMLSCYICIVLLTARQGACSTGQVESGKQCFIAAFTIIIAKPTELTTECYELIIIFPAHLPYASEAVLFSATSVHVCVCDCVSVCPREN